MKASLKTLIFLLLCFANIAVASDEITVDIGTRGLDFGSTGQAEALQQLIKEKPGLNRYQIAYRTEADVIVFGCDINKDMIVRIHNRPDGHGSNESWAGDIMYRISSAATGGSLNDTPSGKQPGSFQTF